MSKKKKFPQRIGLYLNSFLSRKGWHLKLREYRIWTHWEKIVGKKLSRHCRPLRLRHEKLTIAVTSSSWLTQLQFMKSDLLRKIDEHLHLKLSDIYLIVQAFEKPILEEPTPPQVPKPITDTFPRNTNLWNQIEATLPDPELKEIVKRIILKNEQKQTS